ncbi:LamG-like jellyroll fold domain-containing protein [Chengkuizengella axinellae]|uniref:LamG-like jellyroll fold domain-containing protein n=1 Tax=Chengkuizengella axinellae TaxID=3064388 RepID=A0ABT9IWQ4_9BACL|nr:LamG-like jellyroll fold domain-containing protein [Chengkuizengella sp. 2205SS18-9]MDP5273688.1 LamG-like jellyroll fold domain-containing protein [Chengkuizengella sp. 2205SS18-9]
MSKAHKGSGLILKEQLIPVLHHTFHLSCNEDGNASYHGKLITPEVETYTLRGGEGIFHDNVIAVEDSTENLLSTQLGCDCFFTTDEGWTMKNDANYISMIEKSNSSYYGDYILKVIDNDGNIETNEWGGVYAGVVTNLTPLTNYTMSIRYKVVGWTEGDIDVWSHWRDSNGVLSSKSSDYKLDYSTFDGKWHYLENTKSCPEGYDSKHFYIGMNKTNLGCTILVDAIQFEEKEFATSFVNGSRAQGKLYFKDVVNPNEFTMSLWFNIPYMHRVSTNNTGIMGNWYHPIIELCPSSNRGQTGFSIAAGPEPANYSRKLRMRFPYGVTSDVVIQDKQWYHLAVTYDGNDYIVYCNGEIACLYKGGLAPTIYEDTVLMVGGGYYGRANILVNDLRIDPIAVSENDIKAWYESQAPFYNPYDYRAYGY